MKCTIAACTIVQSNKTTIKKALGITQNSESSGLCCHAWPYITYDILSGPEVCTVPCKRCGQVSGCRGVDNGKKCTAAVTSGSGING
jgi:hypothetical protein